jgi:hypothetical protein
MALLPIHFLTVFLAIFAAVFPAMATMPNATATVKTPNCIPAGSALDNFYRGSQGERAYGGEASAWTVYGAAYSGAEEGAKGGASIYFNTVSFGATDSLGVTDSTQYQGSDYSGARVVSLVTRETLMIVGTGGAGAATTASRATLYAGRAFNAIDKTRDAAAIAQGVKQVAQGDSSGYQNIILGAAGIGAVTVAVKTVKNADNVKHVDEVGDGLKNQPIKPGSYGDKPPGWNNKWEWHSSSRGRKGNAGWRWRDEKGGEWRRHSSDKYHPESHWDFNTNDTWNSAWLNVDNYGNLMLFISP